MDKIYEELIPIIEKIKNDYSLYEMDKSALIIQIVNPILKVLNWELENDDFPFDVANNVANDEADCPDYLLRNKGKIIFVKIKGIKEDIDKRDDICKLIQYPKKIGLKKDIRFNILTNGAAWLLIKTIKDENILTYQIIWKADLVNDTPECINKKLSMISKPKLVKIDESVEKMVEKSLIKTYGEC